MAATIFEIIASIFIVLFLFLLIIILPVISSLLKNVNRSFASTRRDVKKQMSESISEMEDVEREIDSLKVVTGQFKSVLDSVLEALDLAIDFFNSRGFKWGLIGSIWFLFASISFPRGLHRRKVVKPKKKVIPPPSWENT